MSGKKKKGIKTPHTFVIIFFVILFCAMLTYVIPVGVYDMQTVTYELNDGTQKERTVLDADTFRHPTDENGDKIYYRTPLFDTEDINGQTGVLNAVFEGMVSGNKWGSAVGVMAFILVVGGAFGVIMRTGAIDNGLRSLIAVMHGKEFVLIPVLFILFSLGGAVFGMGEEAIPFVMIVAPLMVAVGYDSVVALMVTLAATQVGFATSWMNPFSLAIAQGIAGIPVMSGAGFRIMMWCVVTTVSIIYVMFYARKVKANPQISVSYESDAYFRHEKGDANTESKMGIGDVLVLLTLLITMCWVIWGVIKHEYYIPEIASQFFVMGLVAGIIGVIFKMNGMKIDDIARSFQSGAADLLGAALVVGMAKGILLVLGGVDANSPSVLNSILNGAGSMINGFPPAVSAWFMYVFQVIFNFFVTSGSATAALTMPLMAPLSDLVGVSRQVSVLAFQLGDGFTNLIVPTSGVLIACLGAARVDYFNWLRFQWKFQLILFGFGTFFVTLAVMINYV